MAKLTAEISMSNDQSWPDANHWNVTLKYGRRKMLVKFSTGALFGEPTLGDVMYTLFSEAYNLDEPFEEWATNYGLDTNSRKVYAMWQECQRQTHELHVLLGDDYPTIEAQYADY
jgi:hypothetical protein